MICDICHCDPCETPGFCSESRRLDNDAEFLKARAVSRAKMLPSNWHTIKFGMLTHSANDVLKIADSTFDAAEYLVREHLAGRANIDRLSEFLQGYGTEPRSLAEREILIAHMADYRKRRLGRGR